MPLTPGQILQSRYRVIALLAQGGFGAVYQGWDDNLGKLIAIKENLDTSPQAQRQFQHEASILSNLSHPNLPRVTDHFFIAGWGQYLVMDFVEGEDLQAMLDRTQRPLPEVQVLAWIDQVCDALEYLHAQHPPVIHRDIKPANIRITPQGRAVLVDFGISKIYDPTLKTTLGARAVTPPYSPPEQYGQGITDPCSDIYALGATLYTLLTGQEPPESVDRVSNGLPLTPPRQLMSTLASQIDVAIMRACEINRTQRYQSARELRQALQTRGPVPTPTQPQPVVSKTKSSVPPAAKLTKTQLGIIIAIATGMVGIALWLADIALRMPMSTSAIIVTPTKIATRPPRPTNMPTPKVPDTIAKGGYVVVTNGINFRKDANTTAQIIRTLVQGEVLEVIGGPTSANNLVWWQLRDPNGSEGWAAQDYLKPTVLPVPALTITPAQSLKLTQVSDKDGMTLLYVPTGEFTMGSNSGESDEKPPHTVYLDAYYIDQTEVTNVMFKKFIDATGYQTDADKLGSGYAFDATAKSWSDTKGVNWQHPRGPSSNLNGLENHPVVQVSWNDATAYCHWAGGDLPTEAQWEKAARGDDKRAYPWGNQAPNTTRLNYNMKVGDTTQVGAYPTGASFYGALDMAGNLWEWVRDWYDKNYYASSPARNPENTTKSDVRALRGGGWGDAASRVRASIRYWVNPVYRDGNFGFRCARSAQ